MKKMMVILCFILVLAGCSANQDSDTFKIGVIQWAEHPALASAYEGMVAALEASGHEDQFEIILKNANDDVSSAQMIMDNFVAEGVDLVYAIATPAAQTAKTVLESTDIPLIFNAVTDPVAAELVDSLENPGDKVTGVSDAAPMERQMKLIQEILPEAQRIGIIINTAELNSQIQLTQAQEIGQTIGLDVIDRGISNPSELPLVAENLAKEVDAFYIVTDNMVVNAASLVVDHANQAGIPVFTAESGQFDQGILASDSVSYVELGKQAGQMIVKVLIDKLAINDIPVEISENTELLLSQSVAETLNIQIPTSVLERAVLR